MIIHDKFVFCHIPKTGGTFVHMFLKNVFPSCILKPGKNHRPLKSEDITNKFTFSVIRNPWDYYVSLYHANKQHQIGNFVQDVLNLTFKQFVKKILEFSHFDTPVFSTQLQCSYVKSKKGLGSLL